MLVFDENSNLHTSEDRSFTGVGSPEEWIPTDLKGDRDVMYVTDTVAYVYTRYDDDYSDCDYRLINPTSRKDDLAFGPFCRLPNMT